MSAKWRRNKKSLKRVKTFKAFGKFKDKSAPQMPRFKYPRKWKPVYLNRYRLLEIHAGRRMREPEPLIDILEGKDEIMVVAEFAGFNTENLRIHVKNQRLTLSAESSDRKYYKSLNLPKRVIPSTLRTSHKNGVLEIQLKKVIEEKAIDRVAG